MKRKKPKTERAWAIYEDGEFDEIFLDDRIFAEIEVAERQLSWKMQFGEVYPFKMKIQPVRIVPLRHSTH